MQNVGVHKILCKSPGDVSGALALIESGVIDPAKIIAVMGKTEGNGCVNDFTREYATHAWCHALAPHLAISAAEVEHRIAFVMSGGTEGILSPHFTIFTRCVTPGEHDGDPRLAVGVAFTREFLPEELGTTIQAYETERAVKRAMEDAGITGTADVHFVQVKCPLLTSTKMADALARGKQTVVHDTYESMGVSRGASALGVALAMGEVQEQAVTDAAINTDWSLYSGVASASAGIEIDYNVVIVMGMSRSAISPYVIAHGVMSDAIDADSIRTCLVEGLGLALEQRAAVAERVVNVFGKAEASPGGLVRGARHTMLNDSDINSTRHARAAVGAVVASVVGQSAVYVSGGAEHQGPAGGGPFAVIARV